MSKGLHADLQTNISDLLIVEEGVSTYVYRIQYANEIFLRVLPEIGASFAPEVIVHQSLRVLKVSPPPEGAAPLRRCDE